jgi:hypothetical protein
MGKPPHPFCFLVARDLSSIDPFEVHYPIHPMWNAYSPFESMRPKKIERLEGLERLSFPAKRDPTAEKKPWWKFWA